MFTLTFYTDWRPPFNITIGNGPPLEGYINDSGSPQVEVPGLPSGRQSVIVWFGVGDSRPVGTITVLKPVPPAAKWGAILAIAAIVASIVYKQGKKWYRRKRQKKSDDGDFHLPR
jgi:hypothetical protein